MSHNEYEYRSKTYPPMTTNEIVTATRVLQRRLGAGRYPRENEASLRAFMQAARWIAKNCMARLRSCNDAAASQSDAFALRAAMERKRLFSSAAKLTLLMMRIELGLRKLAACGPTHTRQDRRATPGDASATDGRRSHSAAPVGSAAETWPGMARVPPSGLADRPVPVGPGSPGPQIVERPHAT
jgi:hypothetical protein